MSKIKEILRREFTGVEPVKSAYIAFALFVFATFFAPYKFPDFFAQFSVLYPAFITAQGIVSAFYMYLVSKNFPPNSKYRKSSIIIFVLLAIYCVAAIINGVTVSLGR